MATVFELIASEEFDSSTRSPDKPLTPTPAIRIIPTCDAAGSETHTAAKEHEHILSHIGRSDSIQRNSPAELDYCSRLLCLVAEHEADREAVLALRGGAAQAVLDALQSWLDNTSTHHVYRRVAIYLLVKLSASSNQLPASLFISGVDSGASRDATRVGGFADVFRAMYKDTAVAVKRLRIMEGDKADMHPRFCREALIWRQLRHPYVLPFIGVDAETFQSSNFLCMVSPWMNEGTIMDYIKTDAYQPLVDCMRLLREVGEGLFYLHSQKVVHGDINGANIFIDSDHHARLADFGLISLGDKTAGRMSTTMGNIGTVRWMAPERLHADSNARRTQAGDVYAFGCLCLMMHTHKQPFSHLSDFAVIVAVALKGELPKRPTEEQCQGVQMDDDLWTLLLQCWDREPSRRPSMSEVLLHFGVMEPLVKSPTPEKTTFLDEDNGTEELQMAPLYVRRDALPKGLWRQRQERRGLKQKKKEKEERVPGWSRTARVLIVDDDAVIRKLVAKFLQIFGCECDVVTNGADAVEKMNSKQNHYDLVLMDIMMPKLDGVSATSIIRRFDPRTPIISMTTESGPDAVKNYLNHGMNDILPKPFNRDRLFEMLGKHIESLEERQGSPTKENVTTGGLAVPASTTMLGASSSSRRSRSASPVARTRSRTPLKIIIPESGRSTSPVSLHSDQASPIQVVWPKRGSPKAPRLGSYTPFARGGRPRRDESERHRYQPYPRQSAFADTSIPISRVD